MLWMLVSLLFKVFSRLNSTTEENWKCTNSLLSNEDECICLSWGKKLQAGCYCKLVLVADHVKAFFLYNFYLFLYVSSTYERDSERKWGWGRWWWWRAFQWMHCRPCCSNQCVIFQSGSCTLAKGPSGWAELLVRLFLLHSDLDLPLYVWMSVYVDLRYTWGPEYAQRLVTYRYNLQFTAMEFAREVAKGGLDSSCTKYVLPREEWRTSISV